MLFGRFAVAALVLLIVAGKRLFPASRQELLYGLIAGFLLFLGFYVQTAGLRFTTPSNNGFFTATNVMMVPFIAWFLHKKRPPIKLFFCCLMALAGFFILAWNPDIGFSVNLGDLLTLLCAFFLLATLQALVYFPQGGRPAPFLFQIAFAGGFSLIAFAVCSPPFLWPTERGLPAVIFMGLFPPVFAFDSDLAQGKPVLENRCHSLL